MKKITCQKCESSEFEIKKETTTDPSGYSSTTAYKFYCLNCGKEIELTKQERVSLILNYSKITV